MMTTQRKTAGSMGSTGRKGISLLKDNCPNCRDITGSFQEAIAKTGLVPPDEVIADGKIHRFSADGRRGGDSGWYVLYADGVPAGAFGDWRTGVQVTWTMGNKADLPLFQYQILHNRYLERVKARDAERAAAAEQAANVAGVRWVQAMPVTDHGHPYLSAKDVQPHGVRLESRHTLLVPMRDVQGILWGLQSIYPDGTKRFIPGQRVRGLYHSIGKIEGGFDAGLAICEGYATGATVHEASGLPVAIAFNAGNLLPVAMALRDKYPSAMLIVCADDDWCTEGNPGMTKAKEAAVAVGGRLATPDFTGLPRGPKDTDFNDLAQLDKAFDQERALAAQHGGEGVRHDHE